MRRLPPPYTGVGSRVGLHAAAEFDDFQVCSGSAVAFHQLVAFLHHRLEISLELFAPVKTGAQGGKGTPRDGQGIVRSAVEGQAGPVGCGLGAHGSGHFQVEGEGLDDADVPGLHAERVSQCEDPFVGDPLEAFLVLGERGAGHTGLVSEFGLRHVEVFAELRN